MAAIDILKLEHGWAGDRKRNRLIVTSASATTDTLAPLAAGLQEIEAVVPTGRSGSVDGETLVAAGGASYTPSSDVLILYISTSTSAVSSGNYEIYVYGK